MSDPDSAALRRRFQQQERQVQALRAAVFSLPDPSANPDILRQLAAAEQALRSAQQPAPPAPAGAPTTAPHGRLLGPETTGLRVAPTVHMHSLPTGIYHLLDPDADPLLTVVVGNVSTDRKPRRVKAFIEGLSAEAVRTVEIERGKDVTLKLLPTLFPERARAITEVQRATLHLRVEDLDGKPECHDTFPLVCLSRNSSFNAVIRPDTGEPMDLTHYYGAWVTPYAEPVQDCIRRAADMCEGRMIHGYQRGRDSVTEQVKALYAALREAQITYVNSVIDYGAGPGQQTQRTRLPRESLAGKRANCIDGSVLFASLLEGASLNAALVVVPGHALVAWETWHGNNEWRCLETTLVGSADFDAACRSGQQIHDIYQGQSPSPLRMHRLADLRARGIWPME
ncbi:MAG TPA: hypothetical protein VKA46_27470 [Gemmataceae bacterium]|nr:hypothetical protein [Gemmataceae bacterium]